MSNIRHFMDAIWFLAALVFRCTDMILHDSLPYILKLSCHPLRCIKRYKNEILLIKLNFMIRLQKEFSCLSCKSSLDRFKFLKILKPPFLLSYVVENQTKYTFWNVPMWLSNSTNLFWNWIFFVPMTGYWKFCCLKLSYFWEIRQNLFEALQPLQF